jgi:hypothetical protein
MTRTEALIAANARITPVMPHGAAFTYCTWIDGEGWVQGPLVEAGDEAAFMRGIAQAGAAYELVTGEAVTGRIRDWAAHSSGSDYGTTGDVAGLLDAMLAIRAELAAEAA